MGKKWLSKFSSTTLAKKAATGAVAVGLAVGGLSAGAYAAATAGFDVTNPSRSDDIWTMPAEVKGTYCVDFNNSTTPLGNRANGTFDYTIHKINKEDNSLCNVCKDSTVTLNFGCAELAAIGCNMEYYLVGPEYSNNGTPDGNTIVYANATVPYCNKPVSSLTFKFAKDIDWTKAPYKNIASGELRLHLSTQPNSVASPTICFTDACTTSYFEFVDGKMACGDSNKCINTKKVTFADRLEQFIINNVVGPRKDIIALNGICPRSHFAGGGENVPVIPKGVNDEFCCASDPYKSTDYLKLCNNGKNMEDPINDGDSSFNMTLTSTNPNNLASIEKVYLHFPVPDFTFTEANGTYSLHDAPLKENCKWLNPLVIQVANCNGTGGTPLGDGDFYLTTKFNFDNQFLKNFHNNSNPYRYPATIEHPDVKLLTHHWVLEGWEGTVPYLSTYAGYKTFVKIFNDSAKPADVYVDVYPDNGQPIYNVKIGTVGSKQVGLFWASQIRDAANAMGAGLPDATTFAARFVVNALPAFVHGVVIQKGAEGDRVIPIDKAGSYSSPIPQFIPAGSNIVE